MVIIVPFKGTAIIPKTFSQLADHIREVFFKKRENGNFLLIKINLFIHKKKKRKKKKEQSSMLYIHS